MQYTFKYNHVRMAPRKVRLVTELAKKLPINDAIDELKYTQKAAANPVRELLKSAYATLKKKNIEDKNIKIIALTCDQGPTLKRRIFRSRGRATGIKKRSSHIKLVVEIKTNKKTTNKPKKDSHGSKSKSKKS